MKQILTNVARGMATSLAVALGMMFLSCGWWYYRWSPLRTITAFAVAWFAIMFVRVANRIAYVVRSELEAKRNEVLPYGIRRVR